MRERFGFRAKFYSLLRARKESCPPDVIASVMPLFQASRRVKRGVPPKMLSEPIEADSLALAGEVLHAAWRRTVPRSVVLVPAAWSRAKIGLAAVEADAVVLTLCWSDVCRRSSVVRRSDR